MTGFIKDPQKGYEVLDIKKSQKLMNLNWRDGCISCRLTVQHCFESVYSFTNKPELAKSFWVNVKGGSLVSREAEYVLGSDWRKVLNEYANES